MLEKLPRLEIAGEIAVGKYRIGRLALGAMRLLSSQAEIDGQSIECFADPLDPQANAALMQAAVAECGIGYIDFARGYGARPDAGERWFREWMEPYPEGLLWATKVGYQRDAAGGWILDLCPDFLTDQVEASLRCLGAPIPLCYLTAGSTLDVAIQNRPASVVDSFRPLLDFHERGQLLNLGVANVTARQLEQLLQVAPIAAVQNKFTVASLAQPEQREVLEMCRSRGIPFVAWGVFQSDDESAWVPGQNLVQAAQELGMSPQDTSIAVLLQSSPNMVVLTGASRAASLAASVRAANRTVPQDILERFTTDANR